MLVNIFIFKRLLILFSVAKVLNMTGLQSTVSIKNYFIKYHKNSYIS